MVGMDDIEFEKELKVEDTNIPGLLVFDLSVHGDSRGWFKENWQRAKQLALGLPDLRPVQNNISFNAERGVTRGIHAEPWDKYISVAAGSVFGVWVDLRPGEGFGRVYTCTLNPSKAVYVPRGVGNSFQALENGTVYTYLVNAHWSTELKKTYTFVNLADPTLGIEWPIPLSEAIVSEADKVHPMLCDAIPMAPKRTLVTGCNGQLGRAVRALAEDCGVAKYFDFRDSLGFNVADPASYDSVDWSLYGAVVNCAAYTKVDLAEGGGRAACWGANAAGPALLARVCAEYGIVLVHISSDYVFDGTRNLHNEDEPFSPINAYGASKVAGDLAVAGCPKHYIIRSSWVVGDGKNFVKTMATLSDRCADDEDSLKQVTVVNDQLGRLTFAKDIAAGIFWLLGYRKGDVEPSVPCAYGTYNLTSSGPVSSWADVARAVFEIRNNNGSCVHEVSTATYYADAASPIALRPANSTLDFSKIEQTGFHPRVWREALMDYLACSGCI